MRISRLTIDKLGVKLYDKVSAAVAELAANAYDADAEQVHIRLPLNETLGKKAPDGIVDLGWVVEVIDDGHGMTPKEAQDYFLHVGRDRRRNPETRRSREKKRAVMGRKGIGKLAPFGICRRIEVISAGGEETAHGYAISHFVMDFDRIMDKDVEGPVPLEAGSQDRSYAAKRGTSVRLSNFLNKRVPNAETFYRQLATRFTFAKPDFGITVEDTATAGMPEHTIQHIDIPVMPGTKVDLNSHPVKLEDGTSLPVSGWLAFAKDAYKHEELAGVRIYARDKIVATTRDFEQPAGFTGEFTARSYLVGEVFAEWLDQDEGDDLIRTDRQGIIWDSEYGQAFRRWGAKLIRDIASASRKPRREKKSSTFLEASDMQRLAQDTFDDEMVVQVAVELAQQIGGFADEDELKEQSYVDSLASFILAVAPHKALIQAFQEFSEKALGEKVSLESLQDLFGKTRVAEMASYSQIAAERVRVIEELEKIIHGSSDESDLQRLIAGAPWLIEPTWTVITKNQALKTFKTEFEHHYKQHTGETVTLAIGFERKRPDFTLVSVGGMLHVVEIKAAGHAFDDEDFERFYNYVDAFDDFFEAHQQFGREFPQGYQIDLVADDVDLRDSRHRRLWDRFVEDSKATRISWTSFLTRARVSHEEILEVRDRIRETTYRGSGEIPAFE